MRRTVPETAGNSVHFGAEVMQTVSTLSGVLRLVNP